MNTGNQKLGSWLTSILWAFGLGFSQVIDVCLSVWVWAGREVLAPHWNKETGQKNIQRGKEKLLLTLREMPINPFLWHVENARAARWLGGRSGCGRRWLFTEKQGKQRVRATVNSSILLGAAVKTTTHLYFLVSSSDLLSSAQLCSALLRCLLLGCCNFPNHFSGSVGKLFKRLTSQPPPKTPFSGGGVACR